MAQRYADIKCCEQFATSPGSPVHEVFAPKVKPDGSIELKSIGKENTDAFIQSFAESTDMSFILAKLAAGDSSVLRQRVGTYGDFLNVPKTFADVLQLQIDAGRAFDSLDPKIKAQFNNSRDQFLALAGTEKWFEIIGESMPKQLSDLVSESDLKEVTSVES